MRKTGIVVCCVLALKVVSLAQSCTGTAKAGVGGTTTAWLLQGGGLAAYAKMNINLDGYGKAYHPKNYTAGAILHLCNAGKVYLPDGSSYQGSENNATCTGKFMSDYARIAQAGWTDGTIGAINWYGVVADGSATVHGRTVRNVKPAFQPDGSGYFVSPTSLADPAVHDTKDQARYVNPLRVPSAVIPASLASSGIAIGSFGVAVDRRKNIAVPFVVGDGGPRIGEGSAALARMVAGAPLSDAITRTNRGVGQVDTMDVLWVFFGGKPTIFDHTHEEKLIADAREAFTKWGGDSRLHACMAQTPR